MEIKKYLSFKNALTPIKTVNKLVQHHPAANWTAKRTHDYHLSKGWNGIGYNYFIEKDGTIVEGRGLNIGAHCRGYNSTTLGISFSGNFENENMTDEQLKAGIWLNAYLIKKFNLSVNDIVGHKELGQTACPGKNFRMRELKEGVQKELKKKEEQKAPVQNNKEFHTVKKGDTYWGISRDYNISIDELKKLNPNLNPNSLSIGSKVRVKEGKKYFIRTGLFLDKDRAEEVLATLKKDGIWAVIEEHKE